VTVEVFAIIQVVLGDSKEGSFSRGRKVKKRSYVNRSGITLFAY